MPPKEKPRDAHKVRELCNIKGNFTGNACVSPDGQRLAAGGSDHMVRVWDAATGKELLALKGHTKEVTSVVFSADGKRLASACTGWTWQSTVAAGYWAELGATVAVLAPGVPK